MAGAEKPEIDLKIEDRIEVTKGQYEGEKADVVNIYNNTIAVQFDDVFQKEGIKLRTVVKHDSYKKITS
ncbi:hypothetical protein JCM9140_4807 [Halalkalibacter wakoensis JCM 9140]|uniref:KOW domain-containing protein n=1 Tax=Halalkalibacter wakoensis JCM 9140 TaxID=1236970 RepID=W4Q927_9BACI|nr:hypothetical protein [Halalkalibacter wakoensis]GAE28561.1 hypothetical protein JCM9140_4807 [Halalkalibacter wakoensis JCM 9140]